MYFRMINKTIRIVIFCYANRQQLSINVIYYLSINVKTDTQEENFNYLSIWIGEYPLFPNIFIWIGLE
jgi:GH25 family lysozyme M1 (1,4-beta-N-acetylmuramidase)